MTKQAGNTMGPDDDRSGVSVVRPASGVGGGGTSAKPCVVSETFGNGETLTIRFLLDNGTLGPGVAAFVWWGQISSDYDGLIWLMPMGPGAPVQAAFKVAGQWRVMMLIRYSTEPVTPGLRIGGCTPIDQIT